ncbi:MAG: hypothetical protein KDE03_17545 [Rhodobacteraceae bacterium]|nr:hypothetical protein [Paracoccaceae bacterium]
MTFFPSQYDPRETVVGALDLVEMDTPDGPQRFMVGTDGKFIDVAGGVWWGSQLISVSSLSSALNGDAPEGTITLEFFQDPNSTNLIAEVRQLGVEYIAGRSIAFLVQPLRSIAEFYAPTLPPIQIAQRVMRTLTFSASGAQNRSMTVGFEAWTENRRGARRVVLNTAGHAQLIGRANPSLEFIPTNDFREENLFG